MHYILKSFILCFSKYFVMFSNNQSVYKKKSDETVRNKKKLLNIIIKKMKEKNYLYFENEIKIE